MLTPFRCVVSAECDAKTPPCGLVIRRSILPLPPASGRLASMPHAARFFFCWSEPVLWQIYYTQMSVW